MKSKKEPLFTEAQLLRRLLIFEAFELLLIADWMNQKACLEIWLRKWKIFCQQAL